MLSIILSALFLTSWRIFWRYHILLWHNFHTSWCHDALCISAILAALLCYDAMTLWHCLTSWNTFWHLTRHLTRGSIGPWTNALFDIITYFTYVLTLWCTFWRHHVIITLWLTYLRLDVFFFIFFYHSILSIFSKSILTVWCTFWRRAILLKFSHTFRRHYLILGKCH